MAFDHEDTDAVFQEVIKPVLSELNIVAVRVDKQEHNDDIDDRILMELNRCDLCIADLTYARPSVYYEAGHANGRGVPVVFTARADHFKHSQDDHYGNCRIHFDLLMKNIIKWAKGHHKEFSGRLAKRLRVVLRPIVQINQEKNKRENEKAKFSALPINKRLFNIQKCVLATLNDLGYRYVVEFDRTNQYHFKGSQIAVLKRRKIADEYTLLWISETFVKNDFEYMSYIHILGWMEETFKVQQPQRASFVRQPRGKMPTRSNSTIRIVLIAINRLNMSRVASYYPNHHVDAASSVLRQEIAPRYENKLSYKSEVCLVGNIKSLSDVKENLGRLLGK